MRRIQCLSTFVWAHELSLGVFVQVNLLLFWARLHFDRYCSSLGSEFKLGNVLEGAIDWDGSNAQLVEAWIGRKIGLEAIRQS